MNLQNIISNIWTICIMASFVFSVIYFFIVFRFFRVDIIEEEMTDVLVNIIGLYIMWECAVLIFCFTALC